VGGGLAVTNWEGRIGMDGITKWDDFSAGFKNG